MGRIGNVLFNLQDKTVDFVAQGRLIYRFTPEPAVRLMGDNTYHPVAENVDVREENGRIILTYSSKNDAIRKVATLYIKDSILHMRATIYGQGQILEDLRYGNDKIICHNPDNVVRESLFTWAPDLYESLIPTSGKISMDLSTLELKDKDSMARGESGRFIMPPYVAAVNVQGVFLGCATPEIPRSIQGLKPTVIDRCLSFVYEYQGAFVCAEDGTDGPELMLYLTSERDDVIDTYCDYLFDNGLAKAPTEWEDWWSGPLYCTIGDQVYETMLRTGYPNEPGVEETCTEGFMEEMLSIMEKRDIDCSMLVLDAGWMKNMALFDVNEERFPDLRGFANRMREKGKHAILWMAPFNTTFHMTGDCRLIYDEHPDWMVKGRNGEIYPYLDYTNPEVREFMRERVHYMLSNDEGCLDCDGLKVDFYYHMQSPDGFIFHDPSYGTGELLQYKVFKLIYDAAKEAKPWCFVECSSANPLFNDVQDACRLNDDLTNTKSTYEKRCWVTTKARCNIPDTDDWWSYKDYFVKLTLEKCVFGIPALYAVKYRGVQGELISGWESVALGGNPVNISEEDYKRVSAIIKVYKNCPVHLTHRREIDLVTRKFVRYHTEGDLKGFPAAGTLCRDLVLFTCSSDKIMKACAIEPVKAELPLPEGAEVLRVEKTDRHGVTVAAPWWYGGDAITLDLEDAGENGAVYTVVFKK